jgi:hypothetical protein
MRDFQLTLPVQPHEEGFKVGQDSPDFIQLRSLHVNYPALRVTTLADIKFYLGPTCKALGMEDVHRVLCALSATTIHVNITASTGECSDERFMSFAYFAGRLTRTDAIYTLGYKFNSAVWRLLDM